MPASHPRLVVVFLLAAALLLGGCAAGQNPQDPYESFNRGVYKFNDAIDRAVLKPLAEGYRKVLPQFVRSSVSNFFSNINDVVVLVNNLLQGKFTRAYTDFGRIAINSTLGILGLFDIASEAGIEKHDEDFGQTLGWWGIGDGPFIMLPFFGPSTGRDVVGRVGDFFTDPVTYVDPNHTRYIIWGTRVVNRRAELLDASTVLETAALDPYEFVRDAYLQRRRNLIYDGSPPPDREFTEPPAKSQSSTPRGPVFPTAGDTTGVGSILVSGEFQVPVQSTYSQPAPPQPPAAVKVSATRKNASARPIAVTSDGTPVLIGEPVTAVQAEMLAPGQLTTDGFESPTPRELPRLSQIWRALKLRQ